MKNDGKATNFLIKGAQVIGSSAAPVIATAVAGAVTGLSGAIAAAAGSKILEVVIEDMAHRFLSKREQVKVDIVASLAKAEIAERLLHEAPRNDGFFEIRDAGGPSPAEELFEGVLIAAKLEHEQKKLECLARFCANLVFSPHIKPAEANHLLSIAESLTYQQFCILAVYSRKPDFSFREAGWPEKGVIPEENLDLAQQALHLHQRQFLKGKVGWVQDVTNMLPMEGQLTPTGAKIVEMLGLRQIDQCELAQVARAL